LDLQWIHLPMRDIGSFQGAQEFRLTIPSRNEQDGDCFDLLRLLAAYMVLWSHQFGLMKLPEPALLTNGGEAALLIFFSISGYLNGMSILRKPSWWQFLVRRAKRIFPGAAGAALFCAVAGAFLTTADLARYAQAAVTFVVKNTFILFGLRFDLPGVFEANPYLSAVNGSLWSLVIELRFYIYLAVVALIVRYRPTILMALCLIAIPLLILAFPGATSQPFGIAFAFGVLIAATEAHLKHALLPCALAAALFAAVGSWLPLICLLIILAGKIRIHTRQPPVDISYGVYLYAFPVQQFIISQQIGFWPELGLSLAIATLLGLLSARLIEQPALRWRIANLQTRLAN